MRYDIGSGIESFIRHVNYGLSQQIDSGTLIALAGLFLAVLLPVVVLLLETVKDNIWDRAVLLNYVINFRRVLFGVVLMAFPALLWRTGLFTSLLAVLYSTGLIYVIRVLMLSIEWLTDWTESYPNGIKYRLRYGILIDNKIDSNQRIVLWNSYLDSISSAHSSSTNGFADAEHFLKLFQTNYRELTRRRIELLQATSNHLQAIFNQPRSRESEFLDMAYTQLFSLHSSSDEDSWALEYHWQAIIDSDLKQAAGNQSRAYILFNSLFKQTSVDNGQNSDYKLNFIANRLVELLWTRNKGPLDVEYLKSSGWQINSAGLLRKFPHSRARYCLLQAFWEKVEALQQESVPDNEAQARGIRIDKLISQIFNHVDSIALSRLYRLTNFQLYYRDIPTRMAILIELLSEKPLFGYISTSGAIWNSNMRISDSEFFRRDSVERLRESIIVAICSFPLLRQTDATYTVRKIREALSSQRFSKLAQANGVDMAQDSIQAYALLLTHLSWQLFSTQNLIKF